MAVAGDSFDGRRSSYSPKCRKKRATAVEAIYDNKRAKTGEQSKIPARKVVKCKNGSLAAMPPNSALATSAVRAPKSAARRAASTLAGPAPITMMSVTRGEVTTSVRRKFLAGRLWLNLAEISLFDPQLIKEGAGRETQVRFPDSVYPR